jgi:L-amino acid N-acyltransferase YncA
VTDVPRTQESIAFRPATGEDWPAIWRIFSTVVSEGDTYAYPPETDEDDAYELWMHDGTRRRITYVAVEDGQVVATAYLKPNQAGPGDHIANAGWMVAPEVEGRGIGRSFAEYVMAEAKERGYTGMQFNAVVSTNARAITLWESLGFEIVGTVPRAFRHPKEGPVSIHIMYRKL